MKPYVRGKSIFLREVSVEDAEFFFGLCFVLVLFKHISATSNDINQQINFIASYSKSDTDFYFMICDWNWSRLGTVRIYDVRDDSFCWGSWILSRDAPKMAVFVSALLFFVFAFFSLLFLWAHFDVRKKNVKVVDFHKRFGASIVGEDDLNYYFEYDIDAYMIVREKYRRYFP